MNRSAFTISQPRSTALRALNYAPEVDQLRSHARRSFRLGTKLRSLGPSYGSVFTRLDCAPEFGIELMSQADMFCVEPSGRVIRRDSMPNPQHHEVRRWQVLIAGAGTLGEYELYGRSVIADFRLAGKYVGPDALVLTFDEEGGDESLYAYAFLSSQLGIRAVRSASYGTKVLRLRQDILAELPVPQADDSTVARVASLVRRTVEQREQYAQNLIALRTEVESLPELVEAEELCAVRTRRAVSWDGPLPSLSARSVALAGAAAASLRKAWGGTFAEELVAGGLSTGPRFARIECEPPSGVELMSQRDMFLVRPLPQRVLAPGGDVARLRVRPGTILSCAVGQISEGTLFGRVFFAGDDTKMLGFSQNIMRLQVRDDLQEEAFAFLSTTVGHRLLQSAAVGSGYLAMSPPLVRQLPFPRFPAEVSQRVRKRLRAAVAARRQARQAENEAIGIIEQEVLPQWLA